MVLRPSSPWNVDFGETKCRLARFFGEGDDRHLLAFAQYWPDARLGMMAAGSSFKPFVSGRDTDLQFFAAQTPLTTQPYAGTAEGFGATLIYSDVSLENGTAPEGDLTTQAPQMPQLDTEFAAQVQFVSFKQREHEVRLASGPLREAFKLLNECSTDLVRSWGLDIEQHRTMTRRPLWKNAKSLARKLQQNYPIDAARQGESAILRMRVIVSAEGKTESCQILEATNTQWLESPACRYMQNAQFEPALDTQGKPMRSYYATGIIYVIG